MKNLYLLITLFILAACGPSEEEAASEPVNLYEGTYSGNIKSADGGLLSASVKGSTWSVDGGDPCKIEDPFSDVSKLDCGENGTATIKIDEDRTITIVLDEVPAGYVFEFVSGPVR